MSNGGWAGCRSRKYSSNMRFHARAWMAAVDVSTPSRSNRTASNCSRVTRGGPLMRGILNARAVFGNAPFLPTHQATDQRMDQATDQAMEIRHASRAAGGATRGGGGRNWPAGPAAQ